MRAVPEMRAIVHRAYGPPNVLGLRRVPRPVPAANEVLVRVMTSSVTSGDVRMRGFVDAGIFWVPMRLMLGIFRPRNPILGMEFSGQVVTFGREVTGFQPGQPVFGITLHGANAEYLLVPQNGAIITRPADLTHQQAAAIPFGALSALVFLRDFGRLGAGERVLIYGASGSVGVFAVQLAKVFGAHVTAVCSTANLGLVKSLGADLVIDYSQEDFTRRGETYDLIFDTVGATIFSRCKRVLAPKGRHLFLVMGLGTILQSLWTSIWGGRRAICGMSGTSREDLTAVCDLVSAGKIKPVVDRAYPLVETVEAHRYVDTGRKRGAVIITVQDEPPTI